MDWDEMKNFLSAEEFQKISVERDYNNGLSDLDYDCVYRIRFEGEEKQYMIDVKKAVPSNSENFPRYRYKIKFREDYQFDDGVTNWRVLRRGNLGRRTRSSVKSDIKEKVSETIEGKN